LSHTIYFGNFIQCHQGHKLQACVHTGKSAIMCLDCGIISDLEAIGGHVEAKQALVNHVGKDGAHDGQHPPALNQPSRGVGIRRLTAEEMAGDNR